MPERGLYGCFVLSSKSHAKILAVDPKVALGMEGVVDFISAKVIINCKKEEIYVEFLLQKKVEKITFF